MSESTPAAASAAHTYLSTAECAKLLGLTTGALHTRRCRGSAPPCVRLGRTVRYRLSDVERWLDACSEGGAQ